MVPNGFSQRGGSTAATKAAQAAEATEEGGAMEPPAVLLSSARHPSPLPADQRLGVSPREDSPTGESPAEAHEGVMRALNNEGLRCVRDMI